ncbi:MAG: sulfite exporter TauE/SafE family protein [Rhodobacteraceae bacterium]|nr:sulfite exporter TauE/SafE family protein [Paracoccaceae bacterium]
MDLRTLAEGLGGGIGSGAVLTLAGAALLAGAVRGFSGFGSALVFMPVAAAAVSPLWAITMMTTMDLVGPLPALRRAWPAATPRRLAPMVAAMVAGLVPGLWLLVRVPPEAVRWAISGLALALVVPLAAGWRLRGAQGTGPAVAVGGVSGLLAGTTGLAGPPAILYFLASPLPVAQVRANLLFYLLAVDCAMLAALAAGGRLAGTAVVLGAVLVIPFALGAWAGAAAFRPGHERAWRALAYGLIAASALAGLPLWR